MSMTMTDLSSKTHIPKSTLETLVKEGFIEPVSNNGEEYVFDDSILNHAELIDEILTRVDRLKDLPKDKLQQLYEELQRV